MCRRTALLLAGMTTRQNRCGERASIMDRRAFLKAGVLTAAGALSSALLLVPGYAQVSDLPNKSLVRQIDHIIIGSDEPEQLFRLFSEKLSLPVALPFQSYRTFSSGGIGFGNVNIEILARGAANFETQSGLSAAALEPNSLSELLTGLDAHGVKHGAPNPFHQKDASGAERLLWTTVDINQSPFFICKYNFDVDERRAGIQRELQKRSGGPLGIESVMELMIGVRDIAAAQREWSNLFGPLRAGQEPVWQVGLGPAIRLVAAREDHLLLLRVKVNSLERARAFLKDQNLLGLDHLGSELSFDPSHVAGADIRLVE
jgi:hypothetical protein